MNTLFLFKRYRNLSKLLVSFVFTTHLVSCNNASDSKVTHDFGKPTRYTNPLQWMSFEELPYELYQAKNKQRFNILNKEDYPNVRAWAQAWVNQIDSTVRAKYPRRLQNTPKPEVALVGDKSANAFISSSISCLNIKIEGPNPEGAEGGVFFPSKTGLVLYQKEAIAGLSCVDVSNDKIANYFEQFNKKSESDCKVEKANGTLKVNNCMQASAYSSFSSLIIMRANPYVNIHLGLLTELADEDQVVSVLAHELGHYYRAHTNVFDAEYDYFYKQSTVGNMAYKPQPTKDQYLIDLGGSLKASASAYKGVEKLSKKIDGLFIAPVNFYASANLSVNICNFLNVNGEQCPQACKFVVDQASPANSESVNRKLGYYPYGTKYDKDYINELDTNIFTCIEPFVSEPLDSRFITSLYTNTRAWTPYSGSKQFLYKWLSGISGVLSLTDLQGNEDLLTVFETVENLAPTVKDKVKSIYEEAYIQNIGWYTTEQEADDFATELLFYLNVDPLAGAKAFITMQRDLMKQLTDNSVTGSFGYESCSPLFDDNWLKAGVEIMVPVGDFQDNHHSMCYRAFNISREVEAHGYSVDPAKRYQPETISYDIVREIAKSYVKENRSFTRSASFLDDMLDLGEHKCSLFN